MRDRFIGVRLDWDQQKLYQGKLGGMLGTGRQKLLDPEGNPIKEANVPEGYATRYNLHLTPPVLDSVSGKFPPKTVAPALQLAWFLWPAKPPFNAVAMANWDRKPMVIVEGRVPAALENAEFLAWHVRQFIWTRGRTNGPSRLIFKRVMNRSQYDLAVIDAASLSLEQLCRKLDAVLRDYMKQRPFTARGYIENPHGKMFNPIKVQMIQEERIIREQAIAGTLLPPGRKLGAAAPYLEVPVSSK